MISPHRSFLVRHFGGLLRLTLACILLCLPSAAARFSYDAYNRLEKIDLGQGRTITYTYDVAGNLVGRATSFPCFNWEVFMTHVDQWPEEDVSVLSLIEDITCPKETMTVQIVD